VTRSWPASRKPASIIAARMRFSSITRTAREDRTMPGIVTKRKNCAMRDRRPVKGGSSGASTAFLGGHNPKMPLASRRYFQMPAKLPRPLTKPRWLADRTHQVFVADNPLTLVSERRLILHLRSILRHCIILRLANASAFGAGERRSAARKNGRRRRVGVARSRRRERHSKKEELAHANPANALSPPTARIRPAGF
jgi:hypothetical protein